MDTICDRQDQPDGRLSAVPAGENFIFFSGPKFSVHTSTFSHDRSIVITMIRLNASRYFCCHTGQCPPTVQADENSPDRVLNQLEGKQHLQQTENKNKNWHCTTLFSYDLSIIRLADLPTSLTDIHVFRCVSIWLIISMALTVVRDRQGVVSRFLRSKQLPPVSK
jgi:hypothetical protein